MLRPPIARVVIGREDLPDDPTRVYRDVHRIVLTAKIPSDGEIRSVTLRLMGQPAGDGSRWAVCAYDAEDGPMGESQRFLVQSSIRQIHIDTANYMTAQTVAVSPPLRVREGQYIGVQNSSGSYCPEWEESWGTDGVGGMCLSVDDHSDHGQYVWKFEGGVQSESGARKLDTTGRLKERRVGFCAMLSCTPPPAPPLPPQQQLSAAPISRIRADQSQSAALAGVASVAAAAARERMAAGSMHAVADANSVGAGRMVHNPGYRPRQARVAMSHASSGAEDAWATDMQRIEDELAWRQLRGAGTGIADTREKRQPIDVPPPKRVQGLLIGNTAGAVQRPRNPVHDKFGSKAVMDKFGEGRWTWTVFVRPSGGSDARVTHAPLSTMIKSVRFDLHDTFSPPTATRHTEPFEVTRTGWGTFEVGITITYRNGFVQRLVHELSFDQPLTMREVSFPPGVHFSDPQVPLLKVEPHPNVESQPNVTPELAKAQRKQGQEQAPARGWLKNTLRREVEGSNRAILCVASEETRREVRTVTEQMGLQYVGCHTMARALEHLAKSKLRKSTGLPVVIGEPQYVAVVAALGMNESDRLFSKDASSKLLSAATAAGVVAVVFSHTACADPHLKDLALRAGAHAVVNTAEDLVNALMGADVGVAASIASSHSNRTIQDFNDVINGVTSNDQTSGWMPTATEAFQFPENETDEPAQNANAQPTGTQQPGVGRKFDELPEFIDSWSDIEVEFYRELLSQGKQKFEYSKLMIMGPGRVGKTSLLRQLTGQPFDETELSTRGVDACAVDVRTWQHSCRGDTSGSPQSTSQSTLSLYREALAIILAEREIEKRRVVGDIDSTGGSTLGSTGHAATKSRSSSDSCSDSQQQRSQRRTESPPHAGNQHVQPVGSEQEQELDEEELRAAHTLDSITVAQLREAHDEVTSSAIDAAISIQSAWRGYVQRRLYREMRTELEDPQLRSAIEAKVRMLENETQRMDAASVASEERRIMTVLDFAGQRMYYVMHHILMSPRLCVYIVCMSLASDLDEMTDGDEGSSLPMTALENLHFWLNSIAAQAPGAPIVLVATHSDAVSAEQQQMFIRRVEDSFEDTAFERQLHGGIHVVSSVTGEGVSSLRTEIEDVAASLPGFGEAIPLGWLKFIERVSDLVSQGRVRMSLAELRSHAASCSIGMGEGSVDQEFSLLLRMLTDVGLLLWFGETSTRDLVVLKPQWLLDTMRELCDKATLTEKSSSLTSRHLAPQWRMLLSQGRLDATKLAHHIWPDGDSEERKSIIGLMQRFGLCCPFLHGESDGHVYVVPVLLPAYSPTPKAFPDSLFQDHNAVVASVRAFHGDVIDPSSCPSFLPEAIFYSLQIELMMTLSPEDARANWHLYRERIIMLTDEDYFVERVAREQQLRIVVKVDSGNEPAKVAKRVMSLLRSENIASRFGLEFQLCVDCIECGAQISVADELSPGTIIKCPKCRSNQMQTVAKWTSAGLLHPTAVKQQQQQQQQQQQPTRLPQVNTRQGFLEDQGKKADPAVMSALVAARKKLQGQTRKQMEPHLPPQLPNPSQPPQAWVQEVLRYTQDTDLEVRPSDPAAVECDVEDRLSPQDQQTNLSRNIEGVTHAFENMRIPFEQLKYIGELGSGGFGTVHKMTWLQHSEVAVKVLHTDGASAEFMREMSLLASLHHPNILQLYGVTRGSFSPSGHGPVQWMMVCEFMANGSLHTYLHKHHSKVISWGQKLQILVEVAKGMSFLHSDLPAKSRIAHLDLKPDNVLLGKMTVKVADFGVSKGGQHTAGSAAAQNGTYEYMGPEFFWGTGVGTAADVPAPSQINPILQ